MWFHSYSSVIWFQGCPNLLKMILPKQFFVQFLTLMNIWFCSSLCSKTTKSMKINAQQILMKPQYLISFSMTVDDTTNSLYSNLTIRSFLEGWLKAHWVAFSGSLIYRNMILFFQSWNIFFFNIWYRQYNTLLRIWAHSPLNMYLLWFIFYIIFSLVISEGSKSFDEAELFINSSAELKKCNGHLWGVS